MARQIGTSLKTTTLALALACALTGAALARGGDGGGGGGGSDGGGGAGSDGRAEDIYRPSSTVPQPGGPSTEPHPPRTRYMTLTHDGPHSACGGRAIRLIYDINGEPMRYECMPRPR